MIGVFTVQETLQESSFFPSERYNTKSLQSSHVIEEDDKEFVVNLVV